MPKLRLINKPVCAIDQAAYRAIPLEQIGFDIIWGQPCQRRGQIALGLLLRDVYKRQVQSSLAMKNYWRWCWALGLRRRLHDVCSMKQVVPKGFAGRVIKRSVR